MKNALLAALIITASLLIAGCGGCGFNAGCCPDTTTYTTTSCCGSDGW